MSLWVVGLYVFWVNLVGWEFSEAGCCVWLRLGVGFEYWDDPKMEKVLGSSLRWLVGPGLCSIFKARSMPWYKFLRPKTLSSALIPMVSAFMNYPLATSSGIFSTGAKSSMNLRRYSATPIPFASRNSSHCSCNDPLNVVRNDMRSNPLSSSHLLIGCRRFSY